MFASKVNGFMYPEKPIYDKGVEKSDFFTGKYVSLLFLVTQLVLIIDFTHSFLI